MRLLLAGLLCIPIAARADPAEVLGFSPDGRYAAVLEHGISAGDSGPSGFPWARVTILDAKKGAPVGKPLEIELREAGATEKSAIAQARKRAEAEREKLRFASWVPARKIDADKDGQVSEKSGAPIATIEVKTRAGKAAVSCPEPFEPLLLDVEVYFLDADKPARMLSEKRVPKDRPCTNECALDSVYASGKSALALVRCTVPGFEGPGEQLVPALAVLPYPLEE